MIYFSDLTSLTTEQARYEAHSNVERAEFKRSLDNQSIVDRLEPRTDAISVKQRKVLDARSIIESEFSKTSVATTRVTTNKIPLGSLPKEKVNEDRKLRHLRFARPKAFFNGVPFVGFGLYCPPLHGTEVMPLPPAMEKMFFSYVTAAPVSHLEGNDGLDEEFLTNVRTHMDLKLAAWANSPDYQFDPKKERHYETIEKKFPFAIFSVNQRPYKVKDSIPQNEVFKPHETNPNIFDGFENCGIPKELIKIN